MSSLGTTKTTKDMDPRARGREDKTLDWFVFVFVSRDRRSSRTSWLTGYARRRNGYNARTRRTSSADSPDTFWMSARDFNCFR